MGGGERERGSGVEVALLIHILTNSQLPERELVVPQQEIMFLWGGRISTTKFFLAPAPSLQAHHTLASCLNLSLWT